MKREILVKLMVLMLAVLPAVSCGGGGGGDTNSLPVIDAGADFTATPLDYALLQGAATDADSDTLTYLWEADGANPSTVTIENPAGAQAGFFVSPAFTAGDYTFTLTVSDGKGSVSSEVTVTIEEYIETTAVDAGFVGGVGFGTDVAVSDSGSLHIIGVESANSGRGGIIAARWNGTGFDTVSLCPADAATGDRVGIKAAVSGDGNTFLAASLHANSSKGKVYVYTWNGTGWDAAAVEASDGAANDMFGAEMAINYDGTAFVVYSWFAANDYCGKIYLYKKSGSSWVESILDTGDTGYEAGSIRLLGYGLDISGDGSVIIAGAYGSHNGYVSNGGAVNIYTWNGTSYSSETILNVDYVSGSGYDFQFGKDVAISGDGKTFIASSPRWNGDRGKVYIYKLDTGGTWNLDDSLVASDDVSGYMFGNTLDMSGDGSIIAVGADNANSFQGAAYIFRQTDSGYIEYKLTDPEGASNEYYGRRLSLSADGETLMIGVYYKNDQAGSVFTY